MGRREQQSRLPLEHLPFNQQRCLYLSLARSKPESYLTEKGIPLKDDTFHTPLPKGPAGQFSYHGPFSNLIMGYSKNQKAAKDFLRWICSKEIYDQWFTSQQGFRSGAPRLGKTTRYGRSIQ